VGKIVADYLDFTDTVATDYSDLSSSLDSLLTMVQGFIAIAMIITFAYIVLYLVYIAPSVLTANILVETTYVVVIEAAFGYTIWRARQSRGKVEHLSFHMYEAVEMYANTVIDTKSVDAGKPEAEQITELLRHADTELDERLTESPELLQLNTEIRGRKESLKAWVYVGVPWEGRLRKALRSLQKSKMDQVWIAARYEGREPMPLGEIKAFHDKLGDVLTSIKPSTSQIYLFSKVGFSPEAVDFVDDEKSWIPHWKVGSDDEYLATINLVQMGPNGSFVVVTQPWLKTLRRERLETTLEN
jgi:formylmethanofuran dehydrogenase subunit D